jgi:hypothetical protein
LTTVPTNAHERDPLAKASQQLIDVLRDDGGGVQKP